MITYRIILSPRADAELDGIYGYIARDSPANASAMVDQLLAGIDSLELFPIEVLLKPSPEGSITQFARFPCRRT